MKTFGFSLPPVGRALLPFLFSFGFVVGQASAYEPPDSTVSIPTSQDSLCGPLSLSLAGGLAGVKCTSTQIVGMVKLAPEGVEMKDLVGAAQEIGLETNLYKLPTFEYLTQLRKETPAIVLLNQRHYAVVWGAGKDEIWLAEYPQKLRKANVSELNGICDPRVLIVNRPDHPFQFALSPLSIGLISLGVALFLTALFFFRPRLHWPRHSTA